MLPDMPSVAAAGRTDVLAALRTASRKTGLDFDYLLSTATRESGLNAQAKSKTSSATGLFQFVDQTWLGLVKSHGAKYGLGSLAGAISTDSEGRYHAATDADRQAILALKKDPQISALMAGEYAHSTAATMQSELGRPVCGGELYAAHFLGADAACKLIRANQSAPSTSAASLFPQAAGANRSVFFHANGAPKSVREVYDWAMQQPGAGARAPVMEAQAPVDKPSAALRAVGAVDANIQALLAGVLNWQPSGFFSASQGGLNAPLQLSQGMLDIFSAANDG